MITTIALTIMMPTVAIPMRPMRLPSPAMPIEINQPMRLPGPVALGGDLQLPGPVDKFGPAASIKLDIPESASKKAPSAIDTLRKLVKDDRPDFAKNAFDSISLPGAVAPVYVGR